MSPEQVRRREFLKKMAAAAAAGTAATTLRGAVPSGDIPVSGAGGTTRSGAGPASAGFDPKGLPTATLGRTGAVVPRIGIGLGSRFCAVLDEDQAAEILETALDHGFYYWDTAGSYANKSIVSEERIGRVLARRRSEVFLATKFEERTYDGVMRQLETSLKRLRTDHIDLYQAHLVASLADLDTLGLPGGALDALRRIKEQKIARFIGFSGHVDAAAMAEAARRHDFDTMLIALNHYSERRGDFEGGAVPAAAARGLGIMIIKSVRPRETVPGLAASDLIRYALTLPHVHSAVVGTDSVDVVRKNAALLGDFRPLAPGEMDRLTVKLEPFFAGADLPWMKPGYRDGEPC
ncbi:MAG TPA: aldo/keto reductase [Candidatus Aminicenantes bacterium]|nr:aldo/keto reductase [Candidatus Aminicenantes bacterium]HRY66094.1 aldo/keto reductase [Candidatus Aminicenantes bacterium]HRZ72857.1 aldo/keto reductase [Candidatus Aminicenantes bacterium]